ncbi:ComF family protein [Patescibacteria group bacterium]
MKKIIKNILDMLFPIECIGCGEEAKWLCDYCLSKIDLNKKQVCPLCGRFFNMGDSCVCAVNNGIDIYVTFLDLKKNPVATKLIHCLKYNFIQDIAKILAQIVSSEFLHSYTQILNTIDKNIIFIPIPLHKKRMLWRGFNQAESILMEIGVSAETHESARIRNESARILNIRNDILARKKNTLFQGKRKMREKDREKNMRDAFEIDTNQPADLAGEHESGPAVASGEAMADEDEFTRKGTVETVKALMGKTVILFDDVITTGSTMESAARVLKEEGARRVIGMAIGKG